MKKFYAFLQRCCENKLKEIELQVGEDVVQFIVENGADAQYGARPLRRFVQRFVETAVAKELLKGEVLPGDTLKVYMQNGELKITK